MCVHASLSQDGFNWRGQWVAWHHLASLPFDLQGACLHTCGWGGLPTLRMRYMWSGQGSVFCLNCPVILLLGFQSKQWNLLLLYLGVGRGSSVHCLNTVQQLYSSVFTQMSWKLRSTRKHAHVCLQQIYLFIYDKTWKQPKYPLVCEWINKLWYIQTTKYHSVIKRSVLSSHEKTQGNLKCILPREKSQCEKTTHGPNYMTFWRRQKNGDSKEIRGSGRGRKG